MLETLIEMNQPARGKLYSFSRNCRINEYSFNTLPSSHYSDGLFRNGASDEQLADVGPL